MEENTQISNHVSPEDRLFAEIAAEPGSREILYKILDYCRFGRPQEEVKSRIAEWIGTKAVFHSAPLLISRLIECGGLETFDGNGYSELRATEAGKAVAEAAAPSNQLERLFNYMPEYADIFITILFECAKPKTMQELERILSDNKLMKKENIYTCHFVVELEDAGGLEWNGNWVSTKYGIEAAVERNRLNNKS